MQAYLLKIFMLFGAFALDIFLNALPPPLNLISLTTILLGLSILVLNTQTTLFLTLMGGVLQDYQTMSLFGLHAALYSIALGIVVLLRSTIITHESRFSLFLVLLIYNACYFFGLAILTMRFSLVVFEESIFRTLLNTAISFCLLLLIRQVYREITKRFNSP